MTQTGLYLPIADIKRIEEIQKEYAEEELTLKGYVRAVKKIVNPYLEAHLLKEFSLLEKELQNEDITDKGFYNKSKRLLDELTFYVAEAEDEITSRIATNDKENDQNAENNEVEELENCDRSIEDSVKKATTKVKKGGLKARRGSRKKLLEGQPLITNSFLGFTKEMMPSTLPCEPQKDEGQSEPMEDVSQGNLFDDQPSKSNSFLGFPLDPSAGKVADKSLESNVENNGVEAADRVEAAADEEIPSGKRIKTEIENGEDDKREKRPLMSLPPPLKRCDICSQFLSSEDLKIYPGHPEGAVEEFVALTDPRLSLFTGEESSVHEYDQRPQNKITSFTVYDKEGHLCPFDSGLIEKNVFLYLSGFVKPIYDENPSVEEGVPAKDIGPINEWWISGFDGGEKALIGFSTQFAEYILMEPSEVYSSFFNCVQEKIYLSKLVIELLVHSVEPSYEDLLLRVQTAVPPPGISSFSEDSLLRHAQFICDQVHNFDLAGEDWEEKMIFVPCIRALMRLAGVTLGKRGASRVRVIKKIDKMPKMTKATTTPLVRNLFESFFANQLAQEDNMTQANRRARCGVCEVCQEPDCGSCRNCKDMVKFGGSGRSKQCCVNRRCPNMAVMEREESDGEEELEETTVDHLSTGVSMRSHGIKKRNRSIEWIGDSVAVEDKKTFYSEVKINGEVIHLGDCVMVEPDDLKIPVYIARVRALWEVKAKGEKLFHADWFCRGSDTILGETADPQELFLVNDCEDTLLEAVLKKVTVVEYLPPSDWSSLGGPEAADPIEARSDHTFFVQKWYSPEWARFEDIPPPIKSSESKDFKACQSCLRIREEEASEMGVLGDRLERVDNSLNQYSYSSVIYLKCKFEVGDCAYFDPQAIKFKTKTCLPSNEVKKRVVDEATYSEFYRKTSDKVKGSNTDTPEPFRVARILKITCRDSDLSSVSPDDIKLKVAKFFRSENTHKGASSSYQVDLNLLYWSEEEATVLLSSVRGKCSVVFGENLLCSPDDHFLGGPNRFKFLKGYDPDKMEFYDPPAKAQQLGAVGKGKGQGKGKGKAKEARKEIMFEENPVVQKKLRSLDVFAGCGGLSSGMHEVGLSETEWAIEIYEPAAQAFRLNFPDTTVLTDDCNLLLELVMEGKTHNDKGQKLPLKGEVDLLCGGPPCQGFSGMNRFNSRQYSQFKNSLVASYLSYCDYYRPKYFVLENVRNFVSYKCSMVLKLTLRVLIKMGYQCTVGVLQAGNYGVSQTRRRAIILAAAPGEKLPMYPEPLTTFSPRASQLTVVVDNKKYSSNCQWSLSAPLRTITVRDALFDLPCIANGSKKDQINYGSDPESHFQRLIRGKQHQPVLKDHICKEMAPLVEARMKHIPTAPGSDWRDLPNLALRLSDGTFSKVLLYTHHDKKNGRSSTGALRGVCSCVSGRQCDPMDKQFNTLIPWCLPHTGNRHNHWSGLYGRLEWDGFFSTTVTNPEPMGKQGRVLHPEQHRVVSVRECARSQGFSDTYRFYGSILEKHRQIGNAVPPPMAKAIAMEIMKAMLRNDKSTAMTNGF